MKPTFLLLATSLIFGNTDSFIQSKSPKIDTLLGKNTVRRKMAVLGSDDKDIVNISIDDSIVSKYSKGDLKRVLEKNPELNSDNPNPPDVSWGESLKVSDDYNCEACRDDYYTLYAYFLRSKNGESKYRQQRKKLIALYRNINLLFGRLKEGGTYYGHQYTRILGYAEWSIYAHSGDSLYVRIKPYDISKQKELYIKSLKQLIDDEVNNDPELSPGEKDKKRKDLLERLIDIEHLITTRLYLSAAQEFQYSNY